MFIGHGLLAFTLVVLVGRYFGFPSKRLLWLGVLAGVFATLPDIDMIYAPVGLLGGVSGMSAAAESFWETGNIVHRAMTHSVVISGFAALAFGCWTAALNRESFTHKDWPTRGPILACVAALLLSGGLVGITTLVTGALAGFIMAVFIAGGILLATVAARHGIGAREMLGVALVGLMSHPFGDMFTGSPPDLLYPFDVVVVSERVVLHSDPTLHLIGAFLFELGIIWLAVLVYAQFRGMPLRDYVSPRAVIGLSYAGAVFVLPVPTLATSAPFVFSVLAVGFIGVSNIERDLIYRLKMSLRTAGWISLSKSTDLPRSRPVTIAEVPTALLTGLSAVTLAVLGYTVAYLIV
nr:metal-dependent hydrolase [Halomicroarcula laminariae]